MVTARQLEVLRAVAALVARGTSPTVREILAVIGARSTNSVTCYLAVFERKGLATRDDRGRVALTAKGWRCADPANPAGFSSRLAELADPRVAAAMVEILHLAEGGS